MMINNSPLPKSLKDLANLFTYLANNGDLSDDVNMELENEATCDIIVIINDGEVSLIVSSDSDD